MELNRLIFRVWKELAFIQISVTISVIQKHPIVAEIGFVQIHKQIKANNKIQTDHLSTMLLICVVLKKKLNSA